MDVFTSINLNYLPKARALAQSLRKHQPDARFTLMLSERRGALKGSYPEFDRILYVEDLAELVREPLEQWLFRHTVVELCTAVKPFAFQWILEQGGEGAVFYLDPDTILTSSLEPLTTRLQQNSILITPHLCAPDPTPEGIQDHEISCLKHGTYNLGFLGIDRSPEARRVINWWADRLREYCRDEIPAGLFTDQKWFDLVPALFDKVEIYRGAGANAASWNIVNRKVSRATDGRWLANGDPMVFFHFSGFDGGTHDRIVEKYDPRNQELKDFTNEYRESLKRLRDSAADTPWTFGQFSNGRKIERLHRIVYRAHPDVQKTFTKPYETDPAQSGGGYLEWFGRNYRPQLLPYTSDLWFEVAADYRRQLESVLGSKTWRVARSVLDPLSRLLRRA